MTTGLSKLMDSNLSARSYVACTAGLPWILKGSIQLRACAHLRCEVITMKPGKFQVGEVRRTAEGESFSVMTERWARLVTFSYETRQNAIDAHQMVKAALMKVVNVEVQEKKS
jgi:hypothetical protein